jgi:hypothetical protein
LKWARFSHYIEASIMLRRGLLFFLAVTVACTGRDGVRDAGESARSLVRVDVTYTRASQSDEARFDAQAHFVRYRSFDPTGVPTILGIADYDAIPLDTCRVSDGQAELDEALASTSLEARAVPAEVALLDAGRIEVRGPVDRAVLHPHHYPELVPFVAGVVYEASGAGEEASPVTLGLGQPYQVTGDGGEEVGPFVAATLAPRAFPQLQVEPLRRSGGMSSDLEVRWSAEGASASEPLRLEIKWSSRVGARTVRCLVRDDGEFAVSHDAFDALPAQAAATVSASRASRGLFLAPGAGRGELNLELRDVVPLQVTP